MLEQCNWADGELNDFLGNVAPIRPPPQRKLVGLQALLIFSRGLVDMVYNDYVDPAFAGLELQT